MPTYLYKCPTHGEFEEIHSIVTKLEFCPQCESEGNKTEIKRLINGGGSGKGIVELYGQDLVDKVKADSKQIAKDASRSESIYANLLGDQKMSDVTKRLDQQKKDGLFRRR